mgnify:CR=1 FL=1
MAIATLSMLLAAGLSALRLMDRLDQMIADLVNQGRPAVFTQALPDWLIWFAAAVFSFGLAVALLSVAGNWRRWLLWITTLFLVAGWAPVLSLAARSPDISAPWIAALWSGICALFYASHHQMPCDSPRKLKSTITIKKSDEAR